MPQIESFSEKKAAARAATHHKAALLPRKRITQKLPSAFSSLLSGALSEASSLRSAATAAAV
jgi:hypothetical protein